MISRLKGPPPVRGRLLRVLAAPLLVPLAVVAITVAGCGGSSDTTANDAYASSVCSALGTWEQQVKTAVTDLSGGLSRAGVQTQIAQVESATQGLATQLKAVPPPKTSDGQTAAQQFDQLSSNVTTTVASARVAVAQIPPAASAAAVATALATIAPKVKSLRGTAQLTVQSLKDAGGSLSAAFKNADSCKNLGA